MTKSKRFVSANDIAWGDLNHQVLTYSKKRDWQGVIRTYQEMIRICEEEGRDYSHIVGSMEKIKLQAEADVKARDRNLVIKLIIYGLIFFFIIWKPIE